MKRRLRILGESTVGLFALYAVASAVTFLIIGVLIAAGGRDQARSLALGQGLHEAELLAFTTVQPGLGPEPLDSPSGARALPRLDRLARRSIGFNVLALRFYGDDGQLLGPGSSSARDATAARVARARGIERLVSIRAGGATVRAVQVYLPLFPDHGRHPTRAIGVLRLDIPYTTIRGELSTRLHSLYTDLIVGLALLYVILCALGALMSARLRRQIRRNAFLADHDALTGLPNRGSFAHRVADALREQRAGDDSAVVALMELDRFKDINDTLGHHLGDAVLVELADRLRRELGSATDLARVGGDEFGIVLSASARGAEDALHRLRDAISRELQIAGIALAVQATVGYVVAPLDGDEADTLLRRADVAVHAAKAQHRQMMRYEPTLDEHDAAGLSLIAELRRAIDDDELVLHYQPQQELGGDRVVALEALVRWAHPTHGLLFPDRFLGQAEQTDLIDHLTRWVLRRALLDVEGLQDEHGRPFRVAVNVSARSVGGGALADDVIAALAEFSFDPDRVIIEVTETAILADPERAVAELERLREAGVRISLDDFGQGQTSLRHLSTLPLHELKIDREFVGDMDTVEAHAAIVRSMIELGHNLGLQVVAEGVETEAVRERLREAGSDLIQGYLLARPLPLEQIVGWLAAHAAATVRA